MKYTPFLLFLALLHLFVPNVAASNPGMMWGSGIGGLIALIVFILDIIAIVEIIGTHREMLHKLCWILFIIFFPLLGLFIYCLFGKRSHYHHHGHHHYAQVV